MLGRRKPNQKDGNSTPAAVGSIDGVHFENIQGDSMKHSWGSPISGTIIDGVRYAPKNISFNNVQVTYSADQGLHTKPQTPPEYEGQYPDPNLGITFPHLESSFATSMA